MEESDRVDTVVKRLLAEKGLRAKEEPRTIDEVNLNEFDLVVTVCEKSNCIVLPVSKDVERWHIENPVGKDEKVYRKVLARLLVKKLEKS